jgi:hypothetical protein
MVASMEEILSKNKKVVNENVARRCNPARRAVKWG